MTDRPKRNAVANREATDKLLDNRKRRSSAQVQQEKETAAITAAAAEIDKTNLEAQRKRRIAAFEDQLRREDQQRAKSMARPDQQVLSHRAGNPATKQQNVPVVREKAASLKTVTSTIELDKSKSPEPESGLEEDYEVEPERPVPELSDPEFADIRPGESDYMSSEGLIPDDSVVDTESSDGHLGLDVEDVSDGDHEKDEDYVMESTDGNKESDLESDFDVPTKKPSNVKAAKANKPKRGDFRKAINNVRSTTAIAGNTAISMAKMKPGLTAQKRKEPDNKPVGPAIEKRAKKAEGGLLSGWASKLAKQRLATISARNASSREVIEGPDDPLEYAGGEFDEDEPVESAKAAREMKKSIVSVQGNRGTTVKVVEPVAVETSSGGRRVKKVRYTFSSLPFPRGAASTTYTRDWRKSFKPTLINWASTLEDPFGTNAVMNDTVTEVWKAVFPTIASEVDGDSRDAIIHVAADALTDWRSAMGKEGLRLILHAFNEEGVNQEDAPQVAEYYLENYRFIYRNPDDNKGNKGAFLSPLVSTCLAAHLKKTMHYVKPYGYPVGALAIATAVLERGLELIKGESVRLDGTDADLFDDDAATGKKRKTNRYAGFTDAVWGGKTRGWAASAGRLDGDKWTAILQAAMEKMDWSGDDGDVDREEDHSGGTLDPRSLIEIW